MLYVDWNLKAKFLLLHISLVYLKGLSVPLDGLQDISLKVFDTLHKYGVDWWIPIGWSRLLGFTHKFESANKNYILREA